ncbi:hypothetical protein V1477_016446 [Vespula maculifrons]|uniref:Uncharacterized protein n=1 Tax=Vespula maculifrons TaxID=7453 RepID=A0ABD2BD98_VESMC
MVNRIREERVSKRRISTEDAGTIRRMPDDVCASASYSTGHKSKTRDSLALPPAPTPKISHFCLRRTFSDMDADVYVVMKCQPAPPNGVSRSPSLLVDVNPNPYSAFIDDTQTPSVVIPATVGHRVTSCLQQGRSRPF